jgi:hypothetical protein
LKSMNMELKSYIEKEFDILANECLAKLDWNKLSLLLLMKVLKSSGISVFIGVSDDFSLLEIEMEVH